MTSLYSSCDNRRARRFFVDAGVAGEELRRLEGAWTRTVQLHVTLRTRAYAKDGLW